MALLPNRTEMLILPEEAEVVCGKLLSVTRLIENNKAAEPQEKHLFNGWIGQNFQFKISRKTPSNSYFIPLISGNIESTSVGCIVFVRYGLFFSTALFFWIWMLLSLGSSLVLSLVFKELLYGGICALSGLFYYLLLMINFGSQIKKDRETLHKLFNS